MKEKAGFMSFSLLGKRGKKEVVSPVSGVGHQAVPASPRGVKASAFLWLLQALLISPCPHGV